MVEQLIHLYGKLKGKPRRILGYMLLVLASFYITHEAGLLFGNYEIPENFEKILFYAILILVVAYFLLANYRIGLIMIVVLLAMIVYYPNILDNIRGLYHLEKPSDENGEQDSQIHNENEEFISNTDNDSSGGTGFLNGAREKQIELNRYNVWAELPDELRLKAELEVSWSNGNILEQKVGVRSLELKVSTKESDIGSLIIKSDGLTFISTAPSRIQGEFLIYQKNNFRKE